MKFVFTDKNPVETDIITDILADEHISYRVQEQRTPIMTMPFVSTQLITYNIEVNTSLEYFDFINKIAEQKIKLLIGLEKCYNKKCRKKNKCYDELQF